MKVGFLFAGQGVQNIGMGKDLYDNYECIRSIYEKVKENTGIDIADITFYGTEEKLAKTQNTQLAVLTMSLGIIEILNQKNIHANIASGLSLGEYSALIYSGAIGIEDGIKLVDKRGKYMQEFAPAGEWNMAAIIGLSSDQVAKVVEKVKSGFVAIANYNCNGQIAISGEKNAIEEAAEIAKEVGARKVIILKTTGPFHTIKLKEASNKLKIDLDQINYGEFNIPVVKNIDGEIYNKKDDIATILSNHIISPVKFTKCMETMQNDGVDTFIEIGPGKVLSGFAKRTCDGCKILNINDIESLENTVSYINSNKKI